MPNQCVEEMAGRRMGGMADGVGASLPALDGAGPVPQNSRWALRARALCRSLRCLHFLSTNVLLLRAIPVETRRFSLGDDGKSHYKVTGRANI